MSPHPARAATHSSGFPRVSGDEPFAAYADGGIWGFSPRERG